MPQHIAFATLHCLPPFLLAIMSVKRTVSNSSVASNDDDVDKLVSALLERVEDFHEQKRLNKTTFTLNLTRQIERNDLLNKVRSLIATLDTVRGKDVVAEPKKKKTKVGTYTPNQKLDVSACPTCFVPCLLCPVLLLS